MVKFTTQHGKKMLLWLVLSLLGLFVLTSTAGAEQFVKGKDYKIIDVADNITPITQNVPQGKVQVVEFFSYGCPWCFHLEPKLEKWLKTKPDYVVFERIPVVFESGWGIYAKAYYTAKALGVTDKITPAIFNAIHKQGAGLTTPAAMENFFISQGVSKKNFESAFNFSPGIGMEINRGRELMLDYRVFQIPTMIVDGQYKVDAVMVKGNDQKLIQVLDYLVKKSAPPKSLSTN